MNENGMITPDTKVKTTLGVLIAIVVTTSIAVGIYFTLKMEIGEVENKVMAATKQEYARKDMVEEKFKTIDEKLNLIMGSLGITKTSKYLKLIDEKRGSEI